MPRRNLSGARTIVTGASSGIGRELCFQLCQRGADVLATARREDRLVELVQRCSGLPGSIYFIAGDLTDNSHRRAIADSVQCRWTALDVLINNAGAGAIGRFDGASSDRLRKVMEIDFFAPVELTRICLSLLEQGRRPAILNIGSVLSHRAVPNKSEYCAAKFAMRGWSESLRVELARKHIEVLMLSPSTTQSEFLDSLVDTKASEKSKAIGIMSAERVAELAISALVRSKREMILSLGGKALVWAGRLFPRLTDRVLGRFA
ncbi:MAG: SDR family NAD(P)-dependent oxidoreductase [Pirellula sp.]